jgi:hypothetical protein
MLGRRPSQQCDLNDCPIADVLPSDETLMHDMLHLRYLITALLVGGIASRDETWSSLFFVHPAMNS